MPAAAPIYGQDKNLGQGPGTAAPNYGQLKKFGQELSAAAVGIGLPRRLKPKQSGIPVSRKPPQRDSLTRRGAIEPSVNFRSDLIGIEGF